VDKQELRRRSDQVFELAARQLKHLVTRYPDTFPSFTSRGKWTHQRPGWTNWCEGFLGGQLWQVYIYTGDPWFRQQAEHYSSLVEPRKYDTSVHDLGFIFLPTWKLWYDLTGDEKLNQVVIQAGRTLAKRFQEKGGYICSFEGEHSVYIDIMSNIGLVFYAAQQTDDDNLWRIARQHCMTNRRYLVRGDGSTAHEGIFDLQSGCFLRQQTRQGWRDDSSWARGQTWAINGFRDAFSYTQDRAFLETAERLAEFYIQRTPENGVPPNDWDEPDPKLPCESSAAAIAASCMWKLAHSVPDDQRGEFYRRYALGIVDTLTTSHFLAVDQPGWEGILLHGIYHLPQNTGVDESMIWGDYFLLESLNSIMQDEISIQKLVKAH
jgi:unsaturated chondroitin disaccharide hydrolase